jgi:hypothetical protein
MVVQYNHEGRIILKLSQSKDLYMGLWHFLLTLALHTLSIVELNVVDKILTKREIKLIERVFILAKRFYYLWEGESLWFPLLYFANRDENFELKALLTLVLVHAQPQQTVDKKRLQILIVIIGDLAMVPDDQQRLRKSIDQLFKITECVSSPRTLLF